MASIEKQEKLEVAKKKTETNETASDRESSIESFHTNKSEISSEISITTETELIDVDDIELSDEESWLYKSPKKLTSEQKSESTQQWLEKNIDDMNDVELKETRTALLSKLNQLKLLNSSILEKEKKDIKSEATSSSAENKLGSQRKASNGTLETTDKNKIFNKAEIASSSCSDQELRKNDDILNVVDVQKIARLQEESLRQSTYKFLSQTGKKTMSIKDLSPASSSPVVNLSKPASVEALNICADKVSSPNYALVPLHGMKKHNIFSSSTSLNYNNEVHRGSLPNINKGYYSLKSKKSKRPSEPKISCPLPIHPSHSKNNGTSQGSLNIQKKSDFCDHREARTLPSSYRVGSRSNSSFHRDISTLPISPRRESMPFLGSHFQDLNQKDSHRKCSSPSIHSRSNSSVSINSTKAFNSHMQNVGLSPTSEFYRTASHSPTKRLPLATVQHQSPKRGNNLTLSRHGEVTLKMPSKIPSPSLKSGIPVPSTAYPFKANEDDTWRQDCF